MQKKRNKAVAIKYIPGTKAPRIIDKAQGYRAQQLLQIAERHGIMIKKDAVLTDPLFALEKGDWIPESFYEIIAQLLRFVYAIRDGK